MGFEFQEGDTLTGKVLVATPELLDPNFQKTVVYIVEHGASGALGMVMNRPLGKKLGEATQSPDLPKALRELVVRALTTSPVDEFLKLSYFQASPTKRVPFTSNTSTRGLKAFVPDATESRTRLSAAASKE